MKQLDGAVRLDLEATTAAPARAFSTATVWENREAIQRRRSL
jgi:hypothetical protein